MEYKRYKLQSIEAIMEHMSESEKELHRDLIKESLQREKIITRNSKTVQKNMARLIEANVTIENNLEFLANLSTKLQQYAEEVERKTMEVKILSIPDEKFYIA